MHPADRFTLLTVAISGLLAEHAGKISEADLDELADLIAQFVFDRERGRAEASLQKVDEWLSQVEMRLRARLH